MDQPTIPPAPQVCKQCRKPYSDRRTQFCSIKCRIEHNDALDVLFGSVRATCAADGCNRRTRTKKSMYCKECHPKKRVKPKSKLRPAKVVTTTPSVPPGIYQCHWCPRLLQPNQVRINYLNEDYRDHRPENRIVSCDLCHRRKQSALFFLKSLSDDRYRQFIALVPECRNHQY